MFCDLGARDLALGLMASQRRVLEEPEGLGDAARALREAVGLGGRGSRPCSPAHVRKTLRGEAQLSEQTECYRSIVSDLWSHRDRPESPIWAD